jgi:hypothetical protein
MSDLTNSIRRHRTRVVASLAVLAAAATGLVVVPQIASALPPPPVVITAGPVTVDPSSVPVPAAGKYAPFVIKDVGFSVHFATSAALSNTTTFTLTVDSGPDNGLVLGTYDMPKGDQSGDIEAASGVPTAANNVSLKVTARGTTAGTTRVDVVDKFVMGASTAALTGIGAGGGEGVPCNPTSTVGDQTCGDLYMPPGASVSGQLLTQGVCAGAGCKYATGSVLQWLADLNTAPGFDFHQNPITFVAKCDKTLCSKKGVSSYSVKVQTKLTDSAGNPVPPVTSLPCAAKGVVDSGKDFCTDYVQSKRDGAGDVLLFVLFAADAKIIW